MKDFAGLKKNLKKDFSGLKHLKLAILGDTATQFLTQAIKGCGYDAGFEFEIWESDFNQIERQVFDSSSDLYAFNPEFIILFQSTHKLNITYSKLQPQAYNKLADNRLELIQNLCLQIAANSNAKIIYYNYPELDEAVFGNFANKTEQSFLFQLRKLNYELMLYASQNSNFYLCDLSSVQNYLGKTNFFQPAIYVNTDMVLSIDALPLIANRTVDIIGALNAKLKKCLILDLDNTTWGGVIGDDGLENIQLGALGIGKSFTELQLWVKKLKNRGVIIAVCSKNTESVAMAPFQNHPDMVLHLDDIAVFVANWDNKVDNIRKIQSVLNIGFDAMVFLDDNPFERTMVRENIPCITVPELPEDPACYLEYLYTLNLFETVSISSEDTGRTKQYQTEAKRIVLKNKFANERDFLKSLNMVSLVEPFNKFNTPRVAQLSQRSNQFNLRTIRHTETDIQAIANEPDIFSFTFTLTDNLGDNGLICVVILKKSSADTLFIDSWLMSCRVLKRGMEDFALNTLVNFAKEKGYLYLEGEYIATTKNELVKDHYKNLSFTPRGNFWYLAVNEYNNRTCYISGK